ncbi:MAG: hypothetical protein ACTSV1_08245, partial [Alphaproteobacteria bacterium]
MRLFLIVVAFAAAAFPAFSVRADGDRDVDVTVSDWRVVTGDRTEITSDCLGEMTSPVCIVDTMMACGAWSPDSHSLFKERLNRPGGYHPICDALRIQPGDVGVVPRYFGFEPIHPDFVRLTYKVATFQISRDIMDGVILRDFLGHEYGDMEKDSYPKNYYPKPGDTAAVIKFNNCYADEKWRLPSAEGQPPRYREGSPLDYCISGHSPGIEQAAILRQKE